MKWIGVPLWRGVRTSLKVVLGMHDMVNHLFN